MENLEVGVSTGDTLYSDPSNYPALLIPAYDDAKDGVVTPSGLAAKADAFAKSQADAARNTATSKFDSLN